MYNAKSPGEAQFFSNEMSERAQVRLKVETNLRLPWNAKIELFFQPKIDIANSVLRGCEALIVGVTRESSFPAFIPTRAKRPNPAHRGMGAFGSMPGSRRLGPRRISNPDVGQRVRPPDRA